MSTKRPQASTWKFCCRNLIVSIKKHDSNGLLNLFELPPLMIVHQHKPTFKTKITICSKKPISPVFLLALAMNSTSQLRWTRFLCHTCAALWSVNVPNQLLICVTSIWYGRTVIRRPVNLFKYCLNIEIFLGLSYRRTTSKPFLGCV